MHQFVPAKMARRLVKFQTYQILCFVVAAMLFFAATGKGQRSLKWQQAGTNFHDAIPMGNGDMGMSAWAARDGRLNFYLSKTDAYDDNNRLLKIGLVHVEVSPNPFREGQPFEQELDLRSGEMLIRAGEGSAQVNIRLWVDANNPVAHVDLHAAKKFKVRVWLENWRKEPHTITDTSFSDPFANSMDGARSFLPAVQYPDSILKDGSKRITWLHQNKHSCWEGTLKFQGLGGFAASAIDPLLNRVFGASISGAGLARKDDTTLVSQQAVQQQHIEITALTTYSGTVAGWLKLIHGQQDRAQRQDPVKAINEHHGWWQRFWNRSWIDVSGANGDGQIISQGYAVQRWMTGCSGRGKGWIKFNGSIFTLPREAVDPDYRRWGSAQWFQNARLVYWPMIASGDFDILSNFYGIYLSALPLATARTQQYYRHPGAFFPETMYTWGTYSNADYGFNREGLPEGVASNTYIRHYWSGGLELSAMMLDQFAVTESHPFLRDTLLPLAGAITTFYEHHWKNGSDGKILFDPAQSLETWQECVDPLPEIAGLRYVLRRLLELPSSLVPSNLQKTWASTLSRLPDLPVKQEHDSTFLLPAAHFGKLSNVENPELYAVFPYRLFGVGKPAIQTAINTFAARTYRESSCWRQDEIQAACLGLTNEAATGLVKRMLDWNRSFRFPAMWGDGGDELPDLDHGGAGQLTMQNMLLQSRGEELLLFPAWPQGWDVNFKLLAPGNTVVQGSLRGGKLQQLIVTPESRMKDIVIPDPFRKKPWQAILPSRGVPLCEF